MRGLKRYLALALVLVMVLSCLAGCSEAPANGDKSTTGTQQTTPAPTPTPTTPPETTPKATYPDPIELEFTLTEQEIQEIDAMIDSCKTLSYDETASREAVEAAWDELDLKLDYVSSQTMIAQVLYYKNIRNQEANQTYLDAYDDYLALADKANLLQKDMYMDSPVKDWFFEDWPQQDIQYLLTYTTEVADIQSQLNEIDNQFVELSDTALHDGYTELYIKMVTLGNKMAKIMGYDNYYDYMSAMAYSRDYTAEDREAFRNHVKNILMPKFEELNLPYNKAMNRLQTNENQYNHFVAFFNNDYDELNKNYLRGYIDSWTGETHDYLDHVFTNGNYLMTDGFNSYKGAFCGTLDYYDKSFCYFGPGYQSTNTVIHEIGHYYANFFVDDYVAYDLLETHSQGNEMLLLAYMKEAAPGDMYTALKYYNIYNQVITTIIACMVDDFESRIYTMESVEGLTTEDFDRIIGEVCDDYFAAYGGEKYANKALTDMQYYIRRVTGQSPAYYISYATSGVTAVNLFALAEKDEAAGRELYRKLVEEASLVEGYKAALESVGAASPFEEASFKTIVDLFAE